MLTSCSPSTFGWIPSGVFRFATSVRGGIKPVADEAQSITIGSWLFRSHDVLRSLSISEAFLAIVTRTSSSAVSVSTFAMRA